MLADLELGLSEYTQNIPKPMVTIGGKPILWHIMNTYAEFGHKEFHLALGYKAAEIIKEYFLNYSSLELEFFSKFENRKGNFASALNFRLGSHSY